MKNSKYFSVLFILALISFNGCVKLKEVPEGVISPANFYKNDGDFNAAINGSLKSYFGGYGAFDFNNQFLLGGGADDVTSKPDPQLKQYDIFKPDVNGFEAAQEWRLIYQAINSANLIISKIGTASNVSNVNKKLYDAQARYIRALGYFYLVRWFGEIPIITADNQADAIKVAQSSVLDVYNFIISDLKVAESNLPVSFPDVGRPTLGAAKTLLAEVYLTMAGWPLKDVSKYALARDEAKGVMNLNVYALETNFADLWKISNKVTSKELIFSFFGSSKGTYLDGSHLHVTSRPGEEGGWDDMMSEARFFYAFPDGPRKDATFHTVFTDAARTTWQKSHIGQPYIAKYRDAGAAATADGPVILYDGDGFFPVSRYADVLLMYAEAANMAESGPSPAALDAVNQIRRRAGGYNQSVYADLPTGMSQQAFDTAVINERAWEFTFENKRWFDLVRKSMVVSVNKSLYPYVDEHNMLIPKPQKEIDLSKGLLKQNTGY